MFDPQQNALSDSLAVSLAWRCPQGGTHEVFPPTEQAIETKNVEKKIPSPCFCYKCGANISHLFDPNVID